MFRPEVDPLADTIPPRHAYESDEEDEFPTVPTDDSNEPPKTTVEVKIVSSDNRDSVDLIIGSGEAGVVWAKGAGLGEQVGQITVQAVTIGLVFQPSWTSSLAIISEPFAKLPVWAMHEYALAVIEHWQPSRVVIVDNYSTPTYITSEPIPHHQAPIRYLSTSGETPNDTQLFSPPNLLQSTTASFLSILPLPHWSSRSTGNAILLPSSRAPKMHPHTLDPDSESSMLDLDAVEQGEEWDSALLHNVHSIVQELAQVNNKTPWAPPKSSRVGLKGNRRHVSEMEGSMYI